MNKYRVYLFLFLIILLGLGLRLINLGQEPFWGDEALSLDIVHHYQNNLDGLLVYLKTIEVHPPLYYLFLNFWCQAFGWTEFAVRLLSLIFGLGVVLAGYWLYRLLFGPRGSLVAAFLLAVWPFQIEFSQEARPYILFCFFAILSSIVYWRYYQTQKPIFLPLYILSNLVGFYLHYSYVFFFSALGFYWLATIFFSPPAARAKKIYLWLGVHFFIFLGYFFQLVALLYKFFLGHYLLFNTPRTLSQYRGVPFFESVINQLVWLSKNETVPIAQVMAIFIFKVFLCSALIWLLLQQKKSLFARLTQDRSPILFLITIIVLPLVFFVLSPFSFAYAPIFERHVITVTVFLVILFVYLIGLLDLKKKVVLLVLLLITFINPLTLVLGDDSIWDEYFRFQSVAEYINQNYRPGDFVLVSFTIARSDFNHYLRPDIPSLSLYPLELLDYHWDFLSSRETLGLNENEAQLRFLLGPNKDYGRVDSKMEYILKKYQPQRIWFISDKDYNITKWFAENHWRLASDSLGSLHPLKLFDSRLPSSAP